MPGYTVSERFFSKKRRSNDFAGAVSYRPPVTSISITPFAEITKQSPTFYWTSKNVNLVDIYLSSDGGVNFVTIASNIQNLGTYTFTQPRTIETALVKVVDAQNNSVFDTASFHYHITSSSRFFLGDYLFTPAPIISYNSNNNTVEMI